MTVYRGSKLTIIPKMSSDSKNLFTNISLIPIHIFKNVVSPGDTNFNLFIIPHVNKVWNRYLDLWLLSGSSSSFWRISPQGRWRGYARKKDKSFAAVLAYSKTAIVRMHRCISKDSSKTPCINTVMSRCNLSVTLRPSSYRVTADWDWRGKQLPSTIVLNIKLY